MTMDSEYPLKLAGGWQQDGPGLFSRTGDDDDPGAWLHADGTECADPGDHKCSAMWAPSFVSAGLIAAGERALDEAVDTLGDNRLAARLVLEAAVPLIAREIGRGTFRRPRPAVTAATQWKDHRRERPQSPTARRVP